MTYYKTKKLLNHVDDCVDENLAGFLAMNPELCSLEGYPRIVVRRDLEKHKSSGKVTLLTGGGSGHEPAFYGYVGRGMMTAAVHGSLFASPGPGIILAAIRALGYKHQAGVVILFNNYTGDRLNFGIAIERARAAGIKVGVIINGDDCAIDSANRVAGRRGLNGGLANIKMVGALAEQGKTLEEIIHFATKAAKDIATLGVCLTPCSLPGGGPLFTLGPDEMEIGMGLHGEAGVKREKLKSSRETVDMMLSHMTSTELQVHLPLAQGERVAVMLNNLGATSDLEMNIIALDTLNWLESRGVVVERCYSGKFIASQEMQGFSISLIRVNDVRCSLLDMETDATAWIKPLHTKRDPLRPAKQPLSVPGLSNRGDDEGSAAECMQLTQDDGDVVFNVLSEICKMLINSEKELNDLDTACGDGDCGSTFKSGASAIISTLGDRKNPGLDILRPHDLFIVLANLLENHMGGSSGALYSLFLTAAATQLINSVTQGDFIEAFRKGVNCLSEYGGASRGDRTMMDPLYAALDAVGNCKDSYKDKVHDAAMAAALSAEATAGMTARAGRASYVAKERQTRPDAGAKAVAIILSTIADVINKPS